MNTDSNTPSPSWPNVTASAFQWIRPKGTIIPNIQSFWTPDLILKQKLIKIDSPVQYRYQIKRAFIGSDITALDDELNEQKPREIHRQMGFIWKTLRLGQEQVQLVSRRPYCFRPSPKRSWTITAHQHVVSTSASHQIKETFETLHERVIWLYVNSMTKDVVRMQFQFRQNPDVGPDILLINSEGIITQAFMRDRRKNVFELSPECYTKSGRWELSAQYLIGEIKQGLPDHDGLIRSGRTPKGSYVTQLDQV